MSLFKDRAEYLQYELESLLDAVEKYSGALDGQKQGFHFDEYRERRDLDDAIRKAKAALTDEGLYASREF